MKHFLTLTFLSFLLVTGCEQKRTTTESTKTTTRTDTATTSDTSATATNRLAGRLTKVIGFTGAQVTGITIADNGRMFANFPRWHDFIPFSVVEIMPDGNVKAYPDSTWNLWNGKPRANQFTCVQSVVAHGNSLYVLDPSSPKMKGVVGNAMLYEFDLNTNKLKNKYTFDKTVAPAKSYLNDLRVDDKNGRIYITDSGMGAIVVLDPKTKKAQRFLANHPSTKSENISLKIDGKTWTREGKKPQIHSDGIALSPDNDYLFYHALTGYTLYQVPTAALAAGNEAEIAQNVKNLGKTPAPDGMIFDKAGNLYMADLEKNAIVYRTPSGEMRTLVQDSVLKWPDTFTLGKDGQLYFTLSHLGESEGDISNIEFEIYKFPAVAK
ncbi:SMP-30/gluconolactonase/LRE family protein [Adhaeribacter soli]|uniref:Major royal jelly protein n=1 Tax=Adhaeribacter soli TaxID=2607655 RepID=A0A5N1J4Q5_9BACT|nr:L-dopachrome tautomerase-related protein [Adhaeribacter soli]KAA9345697.1 hypothetical protein F0P94_01010 [Adhaeribacter soli]